MREVVLTGVDSQVAKPLRVWLYQVCITEFIGLGTTVHGFDLADWPRKHGHPSKW